MIELEITLAFFSQFAGDGKLSNVNRRTIFRVSIDLKIESEYRLGLLMRSQNRR
jgi:hypothetical protein